MWWAKGKDFSGACFSERADWPADKGVVDYDGGKVYFVH